MTKAQIDEALNFLEGSPEHRELMSRIEMLFDENEDHDPDRSLAIIKMSQNLVGMEAFDEARLVSEALRREQNSMAAEQLSRLIALSATELPAPGKKRPGKARRLT